MSNSLRLIIFDVDGTLVDSQGDILAAMAHAYAEAGLTPPVRDEILSIVGLSLPQAFAQLAPDQPEELRAQMVEWYKQSYLHLRAKGGVAQSSPFYPHVREVLDELHAVPEYLLGVATGKSQRGLDKLIDGHRIRSLFVTTQVADHHPSKPHPSMIHTALKEAGVEADQAVMVGDTRFDMQMARAAGVRAIGVSWGYHHLRTPEDADHMIHDMRDLPGLLADLWGERT